MIRRYYEEEMRYLHEAGKAFAEVHPETARYLNVDSVTDRDPYVERLFEGFAFLTGRIHERLDDELPEFTESLCELLYPHFLRPVPALCLVELKPRAGLVQETTVLKRGLEVRSVPVGDESAVCRFQTTQDVRVQPLQLRETAFDWARDGTSSVRLRFEMERGADYQRLALSPLRLHLHADAGMAATMHLFFTRHVRRVVVRAQDADPRILQGQAWVQPGGLALEEGLLPYGPNSFTGFRLLQEYLCFRRKFWCVDLVGLEQFSPPKGTTAFEVEVVFDRTYPEDQRFKTDNLRLHCTPVVNLFSTEAEPIRADATSVAYQVVPSVRYRRSVATYDVEDVVGVEEATGKRHRYQPFFAFRQEVAARQQRYYVTRRRLGTHDRPELYLSLTGLTLDALAASKSETLSVQVRCTNGSLPREKLQEGMINQLAPDVPQVVQPSNLTQPTLILYPPTRREEDFFWKLISHWSFNYLSVASREALTGLLGLYDWTETEANQRRLRGIREVHWRAKEVIHRGAVLRGAEVHLTAEDAVFPDEGELTLLGLVLSEFFSMYATINSFVHLTVELVPSGKKYQWKPKHGARPIL